MYTEFSRQPRFLPEMPSGEIDVPNPPGSSDKPEISWFSLLAPPAVMLVITTLLAMSSQSAFMLLSIATTVVSLIVSLINVASQIRKYKKKKKEREEKYLQFIADTRSELAIAKEQQIKAMNEMNPDPQECINRIMSVDKKLWERTPSYNDFLSLRVGLGSTRLCMRIQYTKQAIIMESDPLLMEPQRVATEFERVPNVPLSIDLVKTGICGIAGEDDKTAELITLMLLQIVTHHGYDDVRIVILSSDEGLHKWNWLSHVPHIWDDSFSTRFLLCGSALAHQTLAEIYPLLKDREMKSAEGRVLPHYVFIVEDTMLLENEPINKYLYNQSSKVGVSTVFMAKNPAYLPMNCNTVITIQGKTAEIADKATGEKALFIPDKGNLSNLELAARKLGSLRIKNTGANFSIPKSITLLDLYKIKKVSETDVTSRWERNKTYKGMSVPIGAKAGGSSFFLDMHETGCGPHGLVAGTTGSGKSELLQSIIISLAINYHPHDIVFVLIDYKGGGMADVFKGLPHLVGTITNLGGNQTTRALLSIKSELLRRQRVFSEYGVNNIDKYQKLYYNGRGSRMPAIPHLIMIADEFAELKQDQPDFMKELVSTARVGRSLGVHLILATQKPAGVVDDQIWSNSKFKICLKVQDEADSKDVIKRPDAAMIKEPGRAYIQVGNDEVFELFQSAYSGADYDPEGEMKRSENVAKRIYKISLNGKAEQIYPIDEEKISKKELPSQLKAMTEYIIEAAEHKGIKPLDGPWMPPLTERLYFDEIFTEKDITKSKDDILSIPVGIVDDPRGQRQDILKIDFAQDGNLFIYGAPGTGKSYLMKTICLSLAKCYSPEDVNLYVMDFSGTSLRVFDSMPHCGGVMTLEQEGLINQFILFMFRCMDERKRLFEDNGYDSFVDYRRDGKKLPAIVILVDNYFALSETYDEVDAKMILLAREGSKFGIYLVASATNSELVRYKFSVNFKMAVTFQLIDKGEYNGIVGRTEGLEPAGVAGRGLVRDRPPLEFQAALPETNDKDTEEIISEITSTQKKRAVPIPVMPAKIDIQDINNEEGKLAIGLNDNDLQPVYIDLFKTPVIMVAGEALSGKSTLLASWVKMLDNSDIYVLDSSNMGLFEIMDLPHVTDIAKDEDFISKIKKLLDDRRQQMIECRKTSGKIEELASSWKQVIIVFDRFTEFVGNDDLDDMKELVERIIKQEKGMKVAIIAADNTSELSGSWESLVKLLRAEQTGVLLGRIKEQDLFSVRVQYGLTEKEMEFGDGYYIEKSSYAGLRCAFYNKK